MIVATALSSGSRAATISRPASVDASDLFDAMRDSVTAFLSCRDARGYSMQELIWTKVAYVLGDTYPSVAELPASDELTLQKAFFDYLWAFSVVEIVKTIGDEFGPPDPFAKLSRETNEKNAEHRDELRSFPQTYDIELRGAVEVSGPIAADVIHSLAEKEAGCALTPTPEERRQSVNIGCNLLYHAFKKPETKLALRTIHIGATIHAAMRWDKERKFKANDYFDFQHAIAALSYCDVFLTERPLHDLVTQPHTNLGAINGCQILFDIDAATSHIRQLVSIGRTEGE